MHRWNQYPPPHIPTRGATSEISVAGDGIAFAISVGGHGSLRIMDDRLVVVSTLSCMQFLVGSRVTRIENVSSRKGPKIDQSRIRHHLRDDLRDFKYS